MGKERLSVNQFFRIYALIRPKDLESLKVGVQVSATLTNWH